MLGQEKKKCGCSAYLAVGHWRNRYLCSPTKVTPAIDLTEIMCDCVGGGKKKVELG